MNFLGVGFSFGAKDAGLGSFLEGINDQFTNVTQNLENMSAAAPSSMEFGNAGTANIPAKALAESANAADKGASLMQKLGESGKEGASMLAQGAFSAIGAFGKIAGAAGLVGLAIGPVVAGFGAAVDAVQGFAESVAGFLPGMVSKGIKGIQRMNDGINLTNSLEAEAQGLGVTARQLGANMGYTGEQLDDFTGRATSMAMALNMGADTTAKAIRAFDEAGDELRALGLESARDVARFTEAFGVDADTLRNTTMQMTREFGLTTEQVHEVMSATVAFGQASGDVASSLGDLPQIMEHMRGQAAMMGDELDAAELAHHAQSAQALATGFFQLGQNSDQARESAMSLAGSMLESRREFQNMFAGTADELPQFAREIAIATGDVDKAFNMMSQGPDQFVAGMADLVQQTRQNGPEQVGRLLEFMRARLGEAVGPEQADQLVNFFRQATPEILDMMSATAHATRNLGEMGREAHRTGRTMQENFDRAIEGAATALRSVTRAETGRFVRDTAQEMRRLGGAFREIGEQEGVLGGVVRLMSRTAQMGQLGLVPERFRTTAVMANQIHENMQPLIDSVTSVGGFLDAAATQAVLFGTRVAQNMEKVRKEMEEASGAVVSNEEVWRRSFDLTANEFADEWVLTIKRFGPMIENAIRAFAKIDWEELFTPSSSEEGEIADGAIGAFQRVVIALRQVDWSGIWDNLKTGLSNLWREVRPVVVEGLRELWAVIKPLLRELWGGIKSEVLPAAREALGVIWEEVVFPAWAEAFNAFDPITPWWENQMARLQAAWDSVDLLDPSTWGHQNVQRAMDEATNALEQQRAQEAAAEAAIRARIDRERAALEAMGSGSELAAAGGDALAQIHDTAQELHGNSVNTVVGADMDMMVAKISDSAGKSSEVMRKQMYESVLVSITDSFQQGYNTVVSFTNTFTKVLTHSFTTLATTIREVVGQIFLDIVNGAVVTMVIAEDAASVIVRNLQQMAVAQRALADARFEAQEALSPEASPEADQARRRAIMQGPEVIRAIHYPEWYERSGSGFKDLYRYKMDQLIAVVQRGGGQVQTGTGETAAERTERRKRADRAIEALNRGLPVSSASPSGTRR